MNNRKGFIVSLLALIVLLSIAACDTEQQPPGTMYSDGTIRNRDSVWVYDNAMNHWMLYMLMTNNGRTWYAPPSRAITYEHVVARTTARAPLRTSPAYRYVSPNVKPYTGTGTPWKPTTSTSTSLSGRVNYSPKTSVYRSNSNVYRPSTATSTMRSSPMTSTYRSAPMSSGRIR